MGAFLRNRARFSLVTPYEGTRHAETVDKKAIRQAALITLRRAICERFPLSPARTAWLRWLRTCSANSPTIRKSVAVVSRKCLKREHHAVPRVGDLARQGARLAMPHRARRRPRRGAD